MLPLAQDPVAYAAWTADIWMGEPGPPTERDLTIMGLGLGGETGELMDVLAKPAPAAAAYTKELGDIVYYWARICHAFSLDPRNCLAHACPAFADALLPLDALSRQRYMGPPLESMPQCAMELTAAMGTVQELMKKRTRDGTFDPQVLARALGHAGMAWVRMARALELTPSAVVAANVAKITDRHARGVMRGSGDER